MRRATLLTTFALLLAPAVGCVGGFDSAPTPSAEDAPVAGDPAATPPPTDASPEGQRLFAETVSPIFASRCAPCHQIGGVPTDGKPAGPQFLGAAAADYYAKLEADPRYVLAGPVDSLLVIKGEHTGPALTAEELAIVTAWLLQEFTDRNPTTPPPVSDGRPHSLDDALARFGRCMTLDDWRSTGMDNLPNQNTTQGACTACHSTGTAGAFLSLNDSETFTNNSARPFILKLVLGSVNPDGTFKDVVPANRFLNKGEESDGRAGSHPQFLLSDARRQALSDFFDLTYARYSAGDCIAAEVPATVAIRGVTDGGTVSGLVPFEATVADPAGVTSVDFLIDGTLRKTESNAPYCINGDTNGTCNGFDTKQLTNGSHTLRVVARLEAGGSDEASVTFTVAN